MVTPRSKYGKLKGHPRSSSAPNMVQIQLLFPELWHFGKNGVHHFCLIGRHLESGGQNEPVFKLNLALSEERPTNECRSDSGHFLSSYRVNVTSCNFCARAKVPGHRELKIEQNPSLVKLVEGF